jgi:hypothetical protein
MVDDEDDIDHHPDELTEETYHSDSEEASDHDSNEDQDERRLRISLAALTEAPIRNTMATLYKNVSISFFYISLSSFSSCIHLFLHL